MMSLSDPLSELQLEGDVVGLNWIFIKPNCLPFIIQIPRQLYNGPSQNCLPLFIDELHHRYAVVVDEAHILLWVAPLSVYDAADPGWAISVEDLHAHFKNVVPPIALSKQVGATENNELVHVVVTIQDRKSPINTIPELRVFKRYEETVSTPGPTPSQGATLTGYCKVQADITQAIYDGRRAPDSPISTTAPPIQIFHPIFSDFISHLLDPKLQPTIDDLKLVQAFMYSLSVVGRAEEGWGWHGYNEGLLVNLRRILRAEVHEEVYPDGTRSDGVVTLAIGTGGGNTQVVYLITEMKRELGEGGCDPTIQAGLSMKRAWIDPSKQSVRERCGCPTFLIAGGGPWLSILGGVFTDRFIVQRLTDMRWMALSSTEEDSRVYQNARVFVALRESLIKLRHFYLNQIPSAPPFTANHPHPRYFPYPTSFMAEDGRKVDFRYLKSMDENPGCVTYLAEVVNDSKEHARPTKIVVKFVARYGKAAHKRLSLNNWAPTLHYCGPIPGSIPVDSHLTSGGPAPGLNAPPGLCLRANTMHMVVMDYIQPRQKAPKDVRHQLHSILRLLHSEGYVFGDLRKQNILFDIEDADVDEGSLRVKLIDFDWCGRFDMGVRDEPTATATDTGKLPEGLQSEIDANRERVNARDAGFGLTVKPEYARYPLSMSTVDGTWASGMEPLAQIRPLHDWMMLDRLSWR